MPKQISEEEIAAVLEEVQKVILRQHQTAGVDRVVERALVTAVK